jgi:hypothetical protein
MRQIVHETRRARGWDQEDLQIHHQQHQKEVMPQETADW